MSSPDQSKPSDQRCGGLWGSRAGRGTLCRQRGGCYAEHIAVRATCVHVLPAGVAFEHAVFLPNYQVAAAILQAAGAAPSSKSVLVVGAVGGVGSALVQLAKLAGMTVIGTLSSAEKSSFVAALGAGHTINDRTESVPARAVALAAGAGVVGHSRKNPAVRCFSQLRPGSRQAQRDHQGHGSACSSPEKFAPPSPNACRSMKSGARMSSLKAVPAGRRGGSLVADRACWAG